MDIASTDDLLTTTRSVRKRLDLKKPVDPKYCFGPADKVKGEVSVAAGYIYKDGKEAEAEVDGKKFKLFTRGENAWAYDPGSDKAMVAALKSGKQMTVRGTSSRGTATTDTYSLSGFTAALAAIDKACGS